MSEELRREIEAALRRSTVMLAEVAQTQRRVRRTLAASYALDALRPGR